MRKHPHRRILNALTVEDISSVVHDNFALVMVNNAWRNERCNIDSLRRRRVESPWFRRAMSWIARDAEWRWQRGLSSVGLRRTPLPRTATWHASSILSKSYSFVNELLNIKLPSGKDIAPTTSGARLVHRGKVTDGGESVLYSEHQGKEECPSFDNDHLSLHWCLPRSGFWLLSLSFCFCSWVVHLENKKEAVYRVKRQM